MFRSGPEARRAPSRLAWAASLTAMLGGCFDTASAPSPYDEFIEARDRAAAALCMAALECAPEQAPFVCVSFPFGAGPSSDFAVSLNRGRRALDAEATDACIAALATSCAAAARVVSCPVLRPTLAERDACAFDSECVSGACGGDTCPSRCVPRPTTAVGAGAACDAGGVVCEPDLVCARFPGESGEVCGAPSAAGGACISTAGCAAPLECVVGRCASLPIAEGAPCNGAQCEEGLRCLAAECARPPGEGEPCAADRCGARLRCVDDLCERFAGPGEPCADDAECLVTFDCQGGLCTQRPLLGERCGDDLACLEGECLSGVCTDDAPPTAGPRCGTEVCGAGTVCRWAGDERACLPFCG